MDDIFNLAINGDIKQIDLAIKNGFNIDTLNESKRSLLHYACWNNQLELAKYLINNRANVNLADINDFTPLHYACWNDNLMIIIELINHHAKIGVKTKNGKLPIDFTIDDRIRLILNARLDIETNMLKLTL